MENQNEDEEFADEEQESEVHHETNILNRNEQDEAGHSVHQVNSQGCSLFWEQKEKREDFDSLSFIELLVVDHSDIFLMENWEHVLSTHPESGRGT
ncbi:hypothetical protein OJAV_G00236000 [Oryzias javanicus]|uniref:UTP25 NTP hydrolase-like domain-containing protein n=1 Tax=Oryzias javanicus TaxID=123683 RepID=A0A3S2LWW2_ORYJA|nr:hypothetical protein OJAV_G00236000 [Oryzias javanicus]